MVWLPWRPNRRFRFLLQCRSCCCQFYVSSIICCGGSLLVFAQRVYASCETKCTFCFACATIDDAGNFYFLHTWHDIAVCTDVDSDGAFRSAPSCCFSPVCNVPHAIYAARMSFISDTAAQLQHIESQLEDVRALVARQARIVHVACYKSSECSSHLQCAFFYFVLFRGGVLRLLVRMSSSTLGLMQLRQPPLRHLTGAVLG